MPQVHQEDYTSSPRPSSVVARVPCQGAIRQGKRNVGMSSGVNRIGCNLAVNYELAKGQNLDLALTSHRTRLSRCFESIFQFALLFK